VRPPAEAIGALGLIVTAIAFVIFLGVEGALLYSAWRFRASRLPGLAPQISGNRALEIVWTAVPLLILIVVFVLMTGTMREIGTSVAGGSTPAQLKVLAVGAQWWWEYRYPTSGGDVIVANELHIPVNTPVDLDLQTVDVVHSFWVPEISGKTDMIPGKTNHLRLYAAHTGTYSGQCAEFCGVEHAWMRITVVADAPSDFAQWLSVQSANASTNAEAAKGEQVFMNNLCVSCHAIRGTQAKGEAGPDLTHVGSRMTLGAGVLTNNATNMRAWLADPQRYKPGSLMPRVPLSDADLDALVTYLEGLK
jgi:cytochrome c oxidase subunit 2